MRPPEDELRAFVGPSADYYLQAWGKVDPNRDLQRLRWNWPAFFLNFVWLLYRRMYKYFWVATGILTGIGLVEGVIEAMMGIKGPQWFDIPINLAIACFFGAFGTWFYYRHAEWKIAQTRAHHTSREAIVKAGGVRLWPSLVLGVAVLLVLLAAILVPGIAKPT